MKWSCNGTISLWLPATFYKGSLNLGTIDRFIP